jgi:hypothetical protein
MTDKEIPMEVFRRRVINLLVERELLNDGFARNPLTWKHSGFSFDNGVRSEIGLPLSL